MEWSNMRTLEFMKACQSRCSSVEDQIPTLAIAEFYDFVEILRHNSENHRSIRFWVIDYTISQPRRFYSCDVQGYINFDDFNDNENLLDNLYHSLTRLKEKEKRLDK